MTLPFWESKALAEMSREEWESLCDGCGRCCLIKLEDEDDGEIYFTDVACRLLETDTCRCGNYRGRLRLVPDCVQLSADSVGDISWLPSTCAYRLVNEGRPLYPWHPLISGRAESVHEAGVSVAGRVLSETEVSEQDLEEHVICWVD